jgi:hypothetical protein
MDAPRLGAREGQEQVRPHRWASIRGESAERCFDCGAQKTHDIMNAACRGERRDTTLDTLAHAIAQSMHLEGWRMHSNISIKSPRFPLPVPFEQAVATQVMTTLRTRFRMACESERSREVEQWEAWPRPGYDYSVRAPAAMLEEASAPLQLTEGGDNGEY